MRRNALAVFGIIALVGSFMVQPSNPASASEGILQQTINGKVRQNVIQTGKVNRRVLTVSGATQVTADDIMAMRKENADGTGDGNAYFTGSPGTVGCHRNTANDNNGDNKNTYDSNGHGLANVRVNQDCTFRRQAEEDINYNPVDPSNLVAGQNDSRVGYNQCGVDWSLNNGKQWGDMIPPFRQKINYPAFEEPVAPDPSTGNPGDPNRHTLVGGRGTAHTYDAGSDPVNAVDSQGNAYFSCVAFDIYSNASMLYVTRAPKEAKGSFYYNIPDFSRKYIVAEDNSPTVFHDKNWITADKYPSSPNRDNVYVTWTAFRYSPKCGSQPNPHGIEHYCSAPIFGSMSTDHGLHFSTPELISGSSPTLCYFGNFFDPSLSANACSVNQGSNPTALPNGDLSVVFFNQNTDANNPNNQQLSVLCHPSGNSATGTAHLNCAEPSKVGDDISVSEPQCDFGRGPEECIPGAYIRTNDFPRIVTNAHNGHLYATWQDYRNGEYDIQLSQSTDGGKTWHEKGTVNPDRGLDHYMPSVDQSPQVSDAKKSTKDETGGDRVGDSYYRTQRVPNENGTPVGAGGTAFVPCPNPQTSPPTACDPGVQRGNSDYVLSGGTGGQTPYNFTVISPVFPPPDGNQAGFNGDYSAMVINRGTEAHPIWSDTRNTNPFPENGVVHDEDIFTASLNLPSGQGEKSTGTIGSGGGDQH